MPMEDRKKKEEVDARNDADSIGIPDRKDHRRIWSGKIDCGRQEQHLRR